jgi:hypothetical protein
MKALCTTLLADLCALGVVSAQSAKPKTHRLEATPATVAYGYYWSEAKPVLRVASGDIIDVDTLLTNTPRGLERAGVKPEDIQTSLRAVVDTVTDKGPGGHILTGPVYVEGAEPGDALEVRILSIDLAIAYGYNGCSGFLKENCKPNSTKIIPLDRKKMTAAFAPGIVIPLRPFFGSMGVAPAPAAGRVSSTPPGIHAGNLDTVSSWRARRSSFLFMCPAPSSRWGTGMRRKATVKLIRPPSKRRCAAGCSSSSTRARRWRGRARKPPRTTSAWAPTRT